MRRLRWVRATLERQHLTVDVEMGLKEGCRFERYPLSVKVVVVRRTCSW